jgi:hypothetical protein
MKWWAMVRVSGEALAEEGIKPGAFYVYSGSGPIKVLRDIVANDVQSHRSIESGNMWKKKRVGAEWAKGNWKWDPRWK